MAIPWLTAMALLALGAAPRELFAQQTGTWTIGGGAGISVEDARSDSPYLFPGMDGEAVFGLGSVSRALTPTMAIVGELSVARSFTVEQDGRVAGGQAHYVRSHRDAILGAMLRGRIGQGFFWTAGVSVVRSLTTEVATVRPFSGRPVRGPFATRFVRLSPALSFGVDYSAPISERITVRPGVRLHFVSHDEGGPRSLSHLGTSGLIFRPAVVVEFAL